MVRDLLDHLEWYTGLDPKMGALIDLLDRGEVHEQGPGTYGSADLRYQVLEYETDGQGVAAIAEGPQIQIILEGEELFSITGEGEALLVTTSTEGMFIHLGGGERYRHQQGGSGSQAVKKVIFFL